MTSPSNEFVPVLKYAVQTVGTCNLKKDGTRADRGRLEGWKRTRRGRSAHNILGRGRTLLEILGNGLGRAK